MSRRISNVSIREKMLAIIIPYYKIVFFEDTLRSLAEQTNKKFKVYIGDDNSPDNCSLLLKKYEGTFDFSYTRFETNLGSTSLTKQWERCIDMIDDQSIDWLMILGDDDVLGKNVVEEFYNNKAEVDENKINVIRFATEIINYQNKITSIKYSHSKIENVIDFLFKKINGVTRSSLSEYIFNSKSYFLYKFRNYPLAWYSDDRAWLDFTEIGYIYSINYSSVYIRMSEFNISNHSSLNVLKQKNEAAISFFSDLIHENYKVLNKKQKVQTLLQLETNLKKYKKINMNTWLFLFKKYFFLFDILLILKLIRRVLNNLK